MKPLQTQGSLFPFIVPLQNHFFSKVLIKILIIIIITTYHYHHYYYHSLSALEVRDPLAGKIHSFVGQGQCQSPCNCCSQRSRRFPLCPPQWNTPCHFLWESQAHTHSWLCSESEQISGLLSVSHVYKDQDLKWENKQVSHMDYYQHLCLQSG